MTTYIINSMKQIENFLIDNIKEKYIVEDILKQYYLDNHKTKFKPVLEEIKSYRLTPSQMREIEHNRWVNAWRNNIPNI